MHKKLLGTVLGIASLLGGLLVAAPAASANPDWQLWDVTHNRAVASGDTLDGYGTLDFFMSVNGVGLQIECEAPDLFTHDFTMSDQYTAAPGSVDEDKLRLALVTGVPTAP